MKNQPILGVVMVSLSAALVAFVQAQGTRPPAEDKGAIAYGGQVVGPDGLPVPGAKVYLTPSWTNAIQPSLSPESATTRPDGSFQFTGPRPKLRPGLTVTAIAAGHGLGWETVPPGASTDDLMLRLVQDDIHVLGQIVDLEGKPVPDATLLVRRICAAPEDDLGPWLDAVKAKDAISFNLEVRYLRRWTLALSKKITTDAEGRFRLTGIGRNRLVVLQLEGPAIATEELHVLTRPDRPLLVAALGRRAENKASELTTYYPAAFRHVAQPSQPIVGVVRDRDTKRPLVGVSVRNYKFANKLLHYMDGQETVLTTTDDQGRYRLTGMPKGEGNWIKAVPRNDMPYVPVAAKVPEGSGLAPVTVDFELLRGVWIEGRFTDKITGKPVWPGVEYRPTSTNPNVLTGPDCLWLQDHAGTCKEDGSYRILGLPGPGIVIAYNPGWNYLHLSQREDEYGKKEPLDQFLAESVRVNNCGALSQVSPEKGTESVKWDVVLDPGQPFTVRVVGLDGKPLGGTRAFPMGRNWYETELTRAAEFTAWFNPYARDELIFLHLEKGLVGSAVPPAESGGAITVQMTPGAVVTGRLVDADGKPMPGIALQVLFKQKRLSAYVAYLPDRWIKTDRDGRFRVELLVPGPQFSLRGAGGDVKIGTAPRPGETKDLGDVQLRRDGR
jgi:hypothetical protein